MLVDVVFALTCLPEKNINFLCSFSYSSSSVGLDHTGHFQEHLFKATILEVLCAVWEKLGTLKSFLIYIHFPITKETPLIMLRTVLHPEPKADTKTISIRSTYENSLVIWLPTASNKLSWWTVSLSQTRKSPPGVCHYFHYDKWPHYSQHHALADLEFTFILPKSEDSCGMHSAIRPESRSKWSKHYLCVFSQSCSKLILLLSPTWCSLGWG